ncbi:MAG: DUF2804 domain-containing protein [Shewanella sp.]
MVQLVNLANADAQTSAAGSLATEPIDTKSYPEITTIKAPPQLIAPSGEPQYGYFDGIVAELNLDDFDYQTCMDKPASRLAKHFHYKQFQFVGIKTRDYVIGVALADIGYLGSGFAYIYHIKTNRLTQIDWLKPLGLGYQTVPSPKQGIGTIADRHASVRFTITDGQWHLSLQSMAINAELDLIAPPLSLPLALCNPTGYSGWTYTQKHNALKVKGTLTIDGAAVSLLGSSAGYDFSAGFMRRDTSWCWASINSITADGAIGLNLAAGVNETGLNENVFWCNGERHLLGPVQFEFSRKNLNQAWQIKSIDGRVNLSFQGLNQRSERRNLWLLKSNFRQNIGVFNGYVIDNQGRRHIIDNLLGLTEDHYARW